jgi:hypothetical protein
MKIAFTLILSFVYNFYILSLDSIPAKNCNCVLRLMLINICHNQ